MNLKLLLAVILLSLSACVNSPVKDDKPSSDLQAFKLQMKKELAPRTLPNGKTYCIEDSRTEKEHDKCADDLEVLAMRSEIDKASALRFFNKAIEFFEPPRSAWYRFKQHFKKEKAPQ